MSDLPSSIVYVDDDETMTDVVTASFESAEVPSPAVCTSSKDFLDKIGELKPELILMDLQMPDMNGPDTIVALRETDFVNVPIIFMTGFTDVTMSDEYKNLGVIGVIHKPFEVETLVDTIKGIWAESQGGGGDSPAEETGGDEASTEEPSAEE